MKRRDFLRLLLVSPLAPKLEVEKVVFNFHPAQYAFYNLDCLSSYYGIPYHIMNATTGVWLGISRSRNERTR